MYIKNQKVLVDTKDVAQARQRGDWGPYKNFENPLVNTYALGGHSGLWK